MDIENRLLLIDKTTGDVDACLRLLREYKKGRNDLYKKYKQYWILVYLCGQDINSFEDCMSIPDLDRLKIVSKASPSSIDIFPESLLLQCLSFTDTDLLPLIPSLYKKIPAENLITRLIQSQNQSLFFDLPIKIHTIPKINIPLTSYKLLILLSTPTLLPTLISNYLSLSTTNYLKEYTKKHSNGQAIEKSANLENFRIIKYLMIEEDNKNISYCYLNMAKNILSEYLAPPCISVKPLVFEIDEIIDEIVYTDLVKLKDFIFNKMISADIRGKIGEILTKKGVDCKSELEINKIKEKPLIEMPEDLGLELLSIKDYEEADNLISTWRKNKFIKNLES